MEFDGTILSVLEDATDTSAQAHIHTGSRRRLQSQPAAGIDEEALKTLNRDDLKDLFPGPENFLRRKRVWDFINEKCDRTTDKDDSTCGSQSWILPSTSPIPACQPRAPTTISETADKTLKMPDQPEYVLYTDSELDMVRNQYFALLRNGKEKDCKLSKELCCRLIRNTVTSMVAILRASPMGEEVKYPSKVEMRAMAQKIVSYYPMLRDANTNMPYVTIYTKMYKRLQNMRSPRKRQGSMPQRGTAKKALFRSMETHGDINCDASGETSGDTSGSSADTILFESNDDLSEDNSRAASPLQLPSNVLRKPNNSNLASPLSSTLSRTVTASRTTSRTVTASPTTSRTVTASPTTSRTVTASPTTFAVDAHKDSPKMQARHYRTLSNMYKKPNARPNFSDVAQLLDLEFQTRRAFIDADVTREEDRPQKIFEAYPCFKDIRNVMDELHRIVDSTNRKYIEEMKERWASFCAKVQFYGVWKKALKPPFPLDVRGVDFSIALLNALPLLFPSQTPPPKRLGNATEALLHILKPGEDPGLYLEKRPISSPVLLFDGTTCIVAVGNRPVCNLPQEDFWEGMLVLMAYYYTLHLTYPKCVATVLSVIQTVVICDAIHDQDATGAYKKAIDEWNSFIEK